MQHAFLHDMSMSDLLNSGTTRAMLQALHCNTSACLVTTVTTFCILLQVFGITRDPFIVYSSNMFAILSLRALYGFVSSIMSELRYLDKAVALVLGFIGAKMLADLGGYHVSTQASLAVVITTLTGGVAASLLIPAKSKAER